MTQKVHLKGLNGIRAIAAMSVVISHIFWSMGDFDLPEMRGIEAASLAVTMFFTLSGFLITYLLLLEKREFGNISIRQFYIRRVLRIWPLYFFYLFLSIAALLIYQPAALQSNLVFYFVLSANVPLVIGNTVPLISHYWSLAAEEQFYLFWPWVIKKVSSLLKWILWFIIAILILKIVSWIIFKKTGNDIPLGIINATRFQCMAIGAAGAILFFQGNRKFLRFAFSLFIQLIIWTSIVLLAINKFNIAKLINNEAISIITVFLIINVSSNPRTIINLNGWYIEYLGKISYGIYVYHPLVIFLTAKLLGHFIKEADPWYRYAVIYFVITFGTILLAALSYKLFEKPFLLFKERFSRILSFETKNYIASKV